MRKSGTADCNVATAWSWAVPSVDAAACLAGERFSASIRLSKFVNGSDFGTRTPQAPGAKSPIVAMTAATAKRVFMKYPD
jgi:hypothetical protein